jgi:hypothetical protein
MATESDHLKDLRERLARRDVVVLAGAGVAMATVDRQPVDGRQVAGWKGLLEHGVDKAADSQEWRDLRERQLKLDELISVAEAITDKFGGQERGEFKRWMRDSVGALEVREPELIKALHGLGAPIVTTNYDDLIEKVTGLRTLTWQDGSDWQEMIRDGEPAVLHLHGYFRRPSSVILGTRSYERITSDAKAQAMLKALALTRTFLLVGFGDGLQDPNFGVLREWMGRTAPDSIYRHYRLVTSDELEAAQRMHDPAERIVPLVYGDDRSSLGPFLRTLGRSSGVGRGRRSEPQRVLEIHIASADVAAKALSSDIVAKEPLGLDGLRLAMVQTLEEWLRLREDVEPAEGLGGSGGELREAHLLGRILYESVFHGQVKALFDQELAAVAPGQRLAVVLRVARDMVTQLDETGQVNLTSLPWELLYGPQGALALDGRMMLFRALPETGAPPGRIEAPAERLRILVVPAQPSDVLEAARSGWSRQKQQRFDAALADIRTCLSALSRHAAVERVDVLEKPTSTQFNQALRAEQPPNIVHYIGYESLKRENQHRCIAFLQADGERAEWADNQRFADQFRTLAAPPKLVFLHLCEGPRDGYQAPGYDFARASFTELARLLLDRGVQLVVAMQYPMSPDVGAEFTRRFYNSIGAGESVAQAVHAARQQAAQFYRLGGPLLYLHDADETLVPDAKESEPADASPVTDALSPVRGPDEEASTVRGNGGSGHPALGTSRPPVLPSTPLPDSPLTLDVLGMLAERVARAAGAQVDRFVSEVDELAGPLVQGPTGQLDPAGVRTALLNRYRNPGDSPAELWMMLLDKLNRYVETGPRGDR